MPRGKGFTLIELLVVVAILGILAAVGLTSFISSQIKSRDAQRKSDLRQIASALELYYNDKGQYPVGNSGQMMGCGAGAIDTCTWGSLTVKFSNTTTGTIYMAKLPADPSGYSYFYRSTLSSGLYTKYQLYAYLENTQDKSVNADVAAQNIACGTKICNYGVSSGNTTP